MEVLSVKFDFATVLEIGSLLRGVSNPSSNCALLQSDTKHFKVFGTCLQVAFFSDSSAEGTRRARFHRPLRGPPATGAPDGVPSRDAGRPGSLASVRGGATANRLPRDDPAAGPSAQHAHRGRDDGGLPLQRDQPGPLRAASAVHRGKRRRHDF